MDQQSKQGQGHGKRKKEDEAAVSGGNGSSNGTSAALDDFPAELAAPVQAAFEAEKQSVDKGIDAWKKIVASAPTAWAPRRELARVYKKAQRWNAFIEVMKDAVDKANWSRPEDKIPVLREMIEIYRDPLKLDVMVVNAFNQILTIQPNNFEAADELAAQYEGMKRWPDLISLLRKKAAVVESPADKVALQLRIANLFLEKFQNQAEAIKAFEAILEIDPENADALTFVKPMYEKRRDWDKLVAVHQREIEKITDADVRRARRIEVAKLASEKMKKAAISIDLWQKVLTDDPENAEALSELEKLYEREKMWSELGAVLERQVAATSDGSKRSAIYVKLGVLYTEKVQNVPQAITAWNALLQQDPENRRAQDALKKLYLQQKDWNALEGFYASQNKWDELVRVLERQAESEDGGARVGLWNKIGQLYRDRLQKADRAQKAYEKALSYDGRNLEAAQALVPLYEKSKDVKRLAEVLFVELEHTRDAAERHTRLQRLTDLLDMGVADKPSALRVALTALSESPTDTWAIETSRRLARESRAWNDLVQAYEAALPRASDDEQATLALLSTLAAAYESELGNPDAAIDRNQKILALAPKDPNAVAALERLYVATGRFGDLLAVYDKKLELAKTKDEELAIRFKLAGLYEDEIKQPDKAVQLYLAILKQDAAQVSALSALDRLYQQLGRWQELAQVIDAEIRLATENAMVAELKFRRAQVLEQHLDDGAGAVASYREALALSPAHAGARTALQAYLSSADPALQQSAVEVLEPIYEAANDLARLVEVQRIKLGHQKKTDARVELLLRIGKLEGQLGNADQAWEAYTRAFTENPASTPARESLESLANILDNWQPLVALYEKALSAKGKDRLPSALERELLLVVAVAYDEKLEQSERAVEYFRRAQSIQPEDASALVALERLYTRTERWNDLVDTLLKKAQLVTDVAEREEIRIRIAKVWEEMLGNADQAILSWNVVLQDSPSNVAALRALDRLYQARGDWRELADNLQRQLTLVADDSQEKVALLGRLGLLREQPLGQLGGAVDTYAKILQIDPEHPETIAALERILQSPEHELDAAQLLEPIYRVRGDWANLIAVYEVEARHAPDPDQKIALYRQIAEGYELGLDDPAHAYEALGRALAEDPLNGEVQGAIERLARALGRLDDLVDRYGRLVSRVGDPERKNALHHKIARLAEVDLGDDARAAAAYGAALDVWPRDLNAANALEQLYLRGGNYAQLVQLLQRKAEIVEPMAEKKALYYRAAQLYEEVLEDLDRSVAVFQHVLSVDDTDATALDQLERIYIRLARWNELKNVYAKKAELAATPVEKKQMLFVLGQVYDRELGDPERAVETYSSIVDLDPEDYDAVQALDRLYQQLGRWYDLLAVLERQTELAPSPAEVVSLRFRIGELWREHLKDLARAVEAYRQVLQMDPAHEPTVRALEMLMEGGEADSAVLAAQVLEPIYESTGEWDRVTAVYEVMQAAAEEPARKVELLSRMAEIEERRLSHQNAAFDIYGRALHVDPSNTDVLGQLERLAGETGHWAKLANLFATELDKIEDPRRQTDLLLRLGRVYEEESGQTDEAIATYRRAVDADPENRQALVALDRLYGRAQQWEDLAKVVRREIAIASNDEQLVALNFRLAQIYELALMDLPKAVEAYREILVADPTHMETRTALERMFMGGTMQIEIAEVLEPLYRAGEEWEKLHQIYEVQLGRVTDVAERQALLRRLAEIAEHKLVDQVAAFGWWAEAVKEDPSSAQAVDELLRLARATHQWDAYVTTMTDAASPEREPAVRRDVLLRLAASFETDLGDLERSEKALQAVLAEHQKDPAALASLDRIYEGQGMYESLADVLRQRISITDDSAELTAFNLRLGRVYAEALDETDSAIACYLAVLEHEPQSREALDALERLYFRSERWADLYGVYEKLSGLTTEEMALADCYARMAKLAADALDDRSKAVELWGKVVDIRGEDAIALSGLADLHEMAGEWRELTEVLEKQVTATPDPERRIPIYKRLGRIWGEKLSRERNSLESWQKVLEIDPQDVDALRAIAANYRSAGAWEELSQALRRLIQVGQLGGSGIETDELKELFAQLGELEGDTLMRTQDAIDAWREVLELDPAEFRALAALERLFMQEARWEEAVDILERRTQALANPAERVDVLMQAASLWADKIGDGGSAAEVYERVLQIDPSNGTASIELEQLYRQRKSWVKLVDLLLARTEFAPDAASRIQLLVQVGEVYEQQLDDRDSAFVTLQAAFREDYSNDHVAKELERLATAADKWNELIGDYTQVVQGIADPKQAADLWVKIARWYDSALRHVDYAIASAQQALQLDAAHIGALQALEDFYRKKKSWADLASTLARHADCENEPAPKVDILLALADTYETQLGDAAQAVNAYQRALDTDERCIDAINALERLYRRLQAWDRLVEVLAKKSQVVDDTDAAIKLKLQVGELWEDRLGDNDRAVEAYKEVLSVDPRNLPALTALDTLYEKTGRMEEYLENLEHRLEVSPPEEDRVATYQKMASIWEENFAKPDRAAEVIEKILLIDEKNAKAYRDLERLYRQERKWEALVETYRKHLAVATDANERIEIFTKMGQIYEQELRDLDRAIESYNDVLSVEAEHPEALAGIARLYEETEQWDRAVEVMRRLIRISADPKQKVDLNYRLGRIFDEQMKDPEPAQEYLVEALSQDPAHVPSMLSLLGNFKRRGDWQKAAQLRVRAEAAPVNPLEKTRLLHEAGKIFQEKLGDEGQAADLYARVMQLDPEHVETGEPLAQIYFKREEWAPLVPVLEMLARKADKKTNRELTQLYHRLAKAADRLGENEKALKYYKQSYDLDSTYLPTLVDRAGLLYRLEHWDDAFRIYQTILVHHRDTQKDDEIVDIFFRLGRIKLKLNERTKAVNMFEKALEIQPGHRATLQALIELYTDAGDFEAVIKQKRALLAAPATQPEEKFTISEEIAGIYKDKLNNPQKAIAAHLEALNYKPNDRQLLHSLLDLFSETKQWKKAMEILTKLAELESGKVKARYLVAAGNIANYELHSTDEAVELYNQALDEDPDDLKAFERIDKIMTAKKDWKNQERNYRRMIKRIGQEPPAERKPTQIALWHGLGEIYRSRLKDFKAATAAFEVCVQLDPDATPRHQILAELYQLSGPESYDKAVNEYRHLIRSNQDLGQMAIYMKTLRGLYMAMQQYDRAWCVAAAMAFLRKADPEEQQFFEQYRPKGFVRAKARLTEELWKNIYHPDEDRYISHIFATVSQAVASGRAKEHKDWGLKRKDRRDVATDQLLFSKVFNYVNQVLGVPQPELYLRPESPGELDLANAREKTQLIPSFVVGASLLQGRPEKDLAYVVGKKLTFMRPDHFVRWPTVVPTVAELKVLFLAALKLVHPKLEVKADVAQAVTSYLDLLTKTVPPQAREQLVAVVQRFVAGKGEADIHRWANAVDLTATRAGFLICNDLDVATRLVQTEPVSIGVADPKDKVRDLILWSISDEYFAVREHLGLGIGQG
ncbi:MAG: tetratricopeptide repeat protein [Polyangia bacterium]